MSDSARKVLAAAEAAQRLEEKFSQFRPSGDGGCRNCKVPAPIWGPGIGGTDYWYLKMLPPCPLKCAQVITKIWAEITTEYQIVRSAYDLDYARRRVDNSPPRKTVRRDKTAAR